MTFVSPAGTYHSLAVKAGGTVAVWGDNSFGQASAPAGLQNLVSVAGGELHSLALQQSGTAVAWGNDTYGQGEVPAGLTNVIAVAAGGYHNLVLLGEVQRDRPRLLHPSAAAGLIHLPLATTRGKRYLLESKGTLLDAQWTWHSLIVGDGQVRSFTDALGSAPQRFYRVRQID